MDNIKDDNYYVEKIKKDMQFLIDHTTGLTQKEIEKNEILLDCIMFRLVQISENSSKLSDKYKSSTKDIPWWEIKGLRNRIVHDYGNVDYSIIYVTVTKDIPDCYKLLAKY